MKVKDIKTPVSAISGVGPQLAKVLAKVNIFTVGDLLLYFPRDYEDRTRKTTLYEYKKGKVHTVAQVIKHEWFGYGKMKTLKIIISDGTAAGELICFNRTFLEKTLPPGTIVSVTGQFFIKYSRLQSSSFEVNKITPPSSAYENGKVNLQKLSPLNSGILPVYPLTEGLTRKVLTKIIGTAIKQYAHGIEDELPPEIITKRNLLPKQEAIRLIHQPKTIQEANSAKQTLIYEELYQLQYTIAQRAFKHKGSIPSAALTNLDGTEQTSTGTGSTTQALSTANTTISPEDFEHSLSPLQLQLYQKLPFKLTDDQRSVIKTIDDEIDRGFMERNKLLIDQENSTGSTNKLPFTMARLLQGDVGSGKTLAALFACLRVISYKGQCAFMAPTEILARQHAETTSKLLDSLGVRTAFLTGNVKSAGRTQLLKALKNGEVDIVIGTHALFSNQVVYNDLQLAVIDEQHRFGVLQRQAILAKGRKTEDNNLTFEPHLLMMSATPIPQTLALTVFGDLDVSVIKSMPEGRKPIQTFLVKEGNEQNAYNAVLKELQKGHQAYFVYPAIESEFSSDNDDESGNEGGSSGEGYKIKSAEKNFANLSRNIYPDYNCALIHSKVDEERQIQILNDFHAGKIQVLAATTVVEVGVDVPNATCMVIEQADRFGMAQLHQLRGRVGRGKDQSYCILIYSKNLSESGIERMKALRESTDGFYIAEQDLKTRGPGEITGTLQAGNLVLGIADPVRDKDLLLQARTDAFTVFQVLQSKT